MIFRSHSVATRTKSSKSAYAINELTSFTLIEKKLKIVHVFLIETGIKARIDESDPCQ